MRKGRSSPSSSGSGAVILHWRWAPGCLAMATTTMMTLTLSMMDGNAHDAFAMGRGNPSVEHDPYDSADDHKSGSSVWWDEPAFSHLEDAIDDWCDITELEAERCGPALRNRLEGDAPQYKRLLDRELLKDPAKGVNYFKRFLRPHFIKGAQTVFLIQVHASHETQQRYNGLTKMDGKISAYCKQTYWVLDGFGFWFGP